MGGGRGEGGEHCWGLGRRRVGVREVRSTHHRGFGPMPVKMPVRSPVCHVSPANPVVADTINLSLKRLTPATKPDVTAAFLAPLLPFLCHSASRSTRI